MAPSLTLTRPPSPPISSLHPLPPPPPRCHRVSEDIDIWALGRRTELRVGWDDNVNDIAHEAAGIGASQRRTTVFHGSGRNDISNGIARAKPSPSGLRGVGWDDVAYGTAREAAGIGALRRRTTALRCGG